MASQRPINPQDVDVWIFDLDNTLYPARCNLFDQVSQRMTEFIAGSFALSHDDARARQKDYFSRHGTTLRGLMLEDGMDPKAFLDYVHDIDLSPIPPLGALDEALAALPGRKVIFTNGTVAHARRVTDRIGISHHFENVFDIVSADYVPKPDRASYDKLVREHAIVPERAVMVEDIARNLEPAAAMGMTTVWVPGNRDWSGDGHDQPFVHHVVDDLSDWLLSLPGTTPGMRS